MPVETPNPEELEARAAESILGDAGLRDELTDDEAKPLIEWGVSQASAMARRVVAEAALQSDIDTLDESLASLRRLMKRVNRIVGRRAEGDPESLRKDVDRLASLSEKLYGDLVSRPDTAQVEAFLTQQSLLSNEQIVAKLLAMYAPPPEPFNQLDAPPKPGELSAPPKPDQLGAPPKPGELSAPQQPEQLEAPPDRQKLTGPEPPDLLSQGGTPPK